MRCLGILPASALLLLATACTKPPTFKPVASVKQLMQATIDPAADVLFEAVGTIVSASGVEEIAREVRRNGPLFGITP